MDYITYILFRLEHDKYYIGQTNDLERRLNQHNDDKKSWTRKYKPWIVVYRNTHSVRADAMKEEKYIKSLKNKERIKQYISGWRSSVL